MFNRGNRLRRKSLAILRISMILAAMIISYSIFLRQPIQYSRKSKLISTQTPGPDTYPSDWAWMQRMFPYWQADKTAQAEALQAALRLRFGQDQRLAKNTSEARWESVGPTNIGGRVSDIEFNPLDPSIVYAGAATGGVFKSMDSGKTWRPIFDEQAVLPIGDIGIDPLHPDTIYVGTGEANAGHNNFPGGGLYRSSDGGVNWQLLGLETTVTISRIVVDPTNTQRVFLAAAGSYFAANPERGIYRSEDGGDSWTQVLTVTDSTAAIDLVMNPIEPSILFAAMWERVRRPKTTRLSGPSSGIYRSRNGGDTWELLGAGNGLPDPTVRDIGRIGLALSPGTPDIVYALYNDGREYIGLFKTENGGESWINVDPDNELRAGMPPIGLGFGWYLGQVRVSPINPDIVYVLDVDFMKSVDGGANWQFDGGANPNEPGTPGFHVDHHALAFHPENPDYLIDGNDGGINISKDGGVTWERVENLPITQFYEVALDPSNPNRYYGGTQDNNTIRTLTGNSDDWETMFIGDGFYILIDPKNSDIIYAEAQWGHLGKSEDGGETYSIVLDGINNNEPTNWSTPVVMDPGDNLTLYYGTNRVYRTTNGAQTWTAISGDLTSGFIAQSSFGSITSIAVAPTNSNVIYAGTDDGNVWVSDDGGENWFKVSSTLPRRWVTRITIDPKDEKTAYITYSGLKWREPQPHVFRTADFGLTWTDISNNLPDAPVNAFAVDPYYPEILYLGSDVGAFFSLNSGQEWQTLGQGLPIVSVYDMKIQPEEYFLIAGTHGRSMYKIGLQSLHGRRPIFTKFILDDNFPNPFNASTNILYRVDNNNSFVKLAVYDILGRLVRTLVNAERDKGSHLATWDGTTQNGLQAASGVYFYRISIDTGTRNSTAVKKMLLLK